ncbi:MAG TPA: hypothetical protein VFZ42_12705 [Chitinophagaceae bacterium]
MSKHLAACLTLLITIAANAQQIIDLDENVPYEYNGLEYGYYISNETSKEVKGEDYERYEINIYVTNKSGCIKMMPIRNTTSSSSTSKDEVMIAEFNCVNATGKRLTAKKGNVAAKPWYVLARIPDETVKEKFRNINAQVGYAIRDGQTLTTRLIVIVPKGEKPKVNCRIIYLPDIQ